MIIEIVCYMAENLAVRGGSAVFCKNVEMSM
jgi:hypothetical protein